MLGTSNEIKNPGLRILPPGVEKYFVKGGGLSVIEIFAEDKIDIINEEEKKYIQDKEKKLKGPAFLNRSICNNTDDFFNLSFFFIIR